LEVAVFVQFGCGDVFINPLTQGNPATNPTPEQLLGLQDVSIDIDQKFVELKGANKGPDDVATAEMTVKGKASMGRTDIDVLNQAFFADTTVTGITQTIPDEAQTIPATGPFTVTVNSHTLFTKDLGVRYTATAQPLTRVASGPTTGQYAVSAGVYTFAAADTGLGVTISYNVSNAAGKTLTVHNQLMGYGPIVEVYLWEPYGSILNVSNLNGFHFYAARFGKSGNPEKRADFVYVPIEFECFPNAAGQWFDIFDGGGF
jgi:hypothetical protein